MWVVRCIFIFFRFTWRMLFRSARLLSCYYAPGCHTPRCCTWLALVCPPWRVAPLSQDQRHLDIIVTQFHLHMHVKVFDMLPTVRTRYFRNSKAVLYIHVLLQIQRWWEFLFTHLAKLKAIRWKEKCWWEFLFTYLASSFQLLFEARWALDSLVVSDVTEIE